MALPRRRHHDHELPELPPLDGDETDATLDTGVELEEALDEASLDDALADDLAIDDLDVPEATGERGDDLEGPEDPGDAADEIDGDDTAGGWSGDDAREPDDGAEVDELGAFEVDDQGVDGAEGEGADELDELPPLDDDPEGDHPVGDEHVEVPELGAFSLPLREGGVARALLSTEGALHAPIATALGLSVGRDRVYAVGDSLAAIGLSALDDAGAVFEAIEGPPVDELFSSVVEDAAGGLWLGALSGNVWRKARPRDAWRRVAALSEGRSTGAIELLREGGRVWAVTALGTLHRSEEGARFESTLVGEHVRVIAVDPQGGVVAALSGRRRDALRSSVDGGRTWAVITLPDEVSAGCVARVADVCVAAPGEGIEGGYVSVDGGASWRPWPLLSGATALALVAADDGDARVFFAAHDEPSDRVILATARVGAAGEPLDACRIADLGAVFPKGEHDDDEPSHRVDRLVALDRVGRHLALVSARGAVVLVSLRA